MNSYIILISYSFFLTREVCIFGHRVGVPLYTAHFVCFPHRTSKMSTTVVGWETLNILIVIRFVKCTHFNSLNNFTIGILKQQFPNTVAFSSHVFKTN